MPAATRGTIVPSRRRRRDEGSSQAVAGTSSQADAGTSSDGPPRVAKRRIIQYNLDDSVLDLGIARTMVEASVLPVDVRKYENMDWEQMHLTFPSNLGMTYNYLARTEELRKIATDESLKCTLLTRHFEILSQEVEPLKSEASQLKEENASLKSQNSSLKLENTTLREEKEAFETHLATANSQIDELTNKVAYLELTST